MRSHSNRRAGAGGPIAAIALTTFPATAIREAAGGGVDRMQPLVRLAEFLLVAMIRGPAPAACGGCPRCAAGRAASLLEWGTSGLGFGANSPGARSQLQRLWLENLPSIDS